MSTFNVFRYSALGLGIVYGISHRQTLKSQAHKKAEEAKFQKTEALIAEAKEEYAKLHQKPSSGSDLSKIDLDNKNLDFAKVILGAVETLK